MSTGTICDSCGKPAETQERGFIKKIDYCPECAVVADLYLDKRDEIHTDLASQWTDELALLQKEFDGTVLPDV